MDSDTRAKYAHNGEVMLGSAILLFLIVLIVIFFHTYGHLCFRRRRRHLSTHRVPTNSSAATPFNDGLEPSVLKFLPTFTYSSATHLPLHECAVCLSEFSDHDEGRMLPNCNHAFHSHCIDSWFRSHSNCPLCRAPVHQPAAPVQPPEGAPPTAPAPSNIEPCSVSERGGEAGAGQMEEGQVGCSSFSAPIGCPRKVLGVIIEVPAEEEERMRGSDPVPGDHGSKWSDNRILSLKRFLSM